MLRLRVVLLAAVCALLLGGMSLDGVPASAASASNGTVSSASRTTSTAQKTSSTDQKSHSDANKVGPQKRAGTTHHTQSTAHRLAQLSSAGVHTIAEGAISIWQTLTASNPASAKGPKFKWRKFVNALVSLAIIVVATFAAWFILFALIRRLFIWLDRYAREAAGRDTGPVATWTRRAGATLAALIIDALGVVLASAAGAAVAGGITQAGTQAAIRGLLFVNAFFVVEMLKVAVRAVFSTSYSALRPSPMSSTLAGWWSIRLRWLIGWLGYGILVAVPVLNKQVSSSLAAFVYLIVCAVALIFSIVALFGYRHTLTRVFSNRASNARFMVIGLLYRFFARIWLPLATAYLVVLFLLTQLPTPQVLAFFIRASLETALALSIGWVLCRIIDLLRRLSRQLGAHLAGKVAQLERQIDRYIPIIALCLKLLVIIFVAGSLINIWHIIDFAGWLHSNAGASTLGAAIRVLLVVIMAIAIWIVTSAMLEYRLSPNTGSGAPNSRQKTLITLLRNVLAIIIITLTAMIALSQIGVNIGPLIASAGILGLAIGFGAQTLVQDVISGIFIQLENSMNVGDVVSTANVFGTVERLTIRSAAIRDLEGAYHVVPFSSSRVVSNYMREGTICKGEYAIALGEDIDNAISCLHEAFAALKSDPDASPHIRSGLTIPGVSAIESSGIRIRTMITTEPGMQWAVGRMFNRYVKIHFDRAGIEIPFPHQKIYFGNNATETSKALRSTPSNPDDPGGVNVDGSS